MSGAVTCVSRVYRTFIARMLASSGCAHAESLEPRAMMDATFVPGADLPLSSGEGVTMVVDLDADGDPDIIDWDGSVFRNDGGAAYVPQGSLPQVSEFFERYANGYNPEGHATPLDVDGDGDLDFVTTRHLVVFNDGNFQFHMGAGTGLAYGDYTRLAAIDVNHDAFGDLVMQRGGKIWIMRGRGDGTFAWSLAADGAAWNGTSTDKPQVADLNGDGQDDIIAGRLVLIREGGTWRSQSLPGNALEVRPVDIDDDGDQDIAYKVPNQEGANILRNNGAGVLTPIAWNSQATLRRDPYAARGDFNADGIEDEVVFTRHEMYRGPTEYRWYLRLGSGGGWVGAPTELNVHSTYWGPYPKNFVADMNSDGIDDLLPNQITMLLGTQSTPDTKFAFAHDTTLVNTSMFGGIPPFPYVVPGQRERYVIEGLRTGIAYSVRVQEDTNGNDILDGGDLTISFASNRAGRFFTGEAAWTDSGQFGLRKWFAKVTYNDGQVQAFDGTVQLWVRSFFPEGFQGSTSREFLPISNDSNEGVRFEVVRHLPDGTAIRMFGDGSPLSYYSTGSIGPFMRGSPASPYGQGNIVLSDAGVSSPGIGAYAVELQSSRPLGAVLVRYDTTFGVTQGMGESLTTTKSATWTFPDVSTSGSDYILLYNPEPWGPANVRVTFYTASGQVAATVDQSVGKLARGGLLVRDVAGLQPGQSYSAVVSGIGTTLPFVASLSRYAVDPGQSFMALGQPLQASGSGYTRRSSVLASVGSGATTQNSIVLFNPLAQAQTVSIYRAPTGGVETLAQTVTLGAFERRVLQLGSTGSGERYSSLRAIGSVSEVGLAAVTRFAGRNDAVATGAVSYASTKWAFAEGYVHRPDTQISSEELYLYNPGTSATSITLRFLFPNGSTGTYTLSVAARRSSRVRLDQVPALAGRTDLNWYSTIVESTLPVVAQYTHWDLSATGGFTTLGMAMGPRIAIA